MDMTHVAEREDSKKRAGPGRPDPRTARRPTTSRNSSTSPVNGHRSPVAPAGPRARARDVRAARFPPRDSKKEFTSVAPIAGDNSRCAGPPCRTERTVRSAAIDETAATVVCVNGRFSADLVAHAFRRQVLSLEAALSSHPDLMERTHAHCTRRIMRSALNTAFLGTACRSSSRPGRSSRTHTRALRLVGAERVGCGFPRAIARGRRRAEPGADRGTLRWAGLEAGFTNAITEIALSAGVISITTSCRKNRPGVHVAGLSIHGDQDSTFCPIR